MSGKPHTHTQHNHCAAKNLSIEEDSHRTDAGGHVRDGHVETIDDNRVARRAVKPGGGRRREKRVPTELRPSRGDNAGKKIAHPAKRHKWIARRILVHLLAIRRYDKRPRALQNNGSAIASRNLLRSGNSAAGDFRAGDAEKSRRLALVRSEDNRRATIASACIFAYCGEMRQRVCIDYEPPFLGKKPAHKSRRFLVKPEPGPDDRHIGMRNIATKVRHRRLWEQSPCGKARLRRDDETNEPRTSGTCAEASDHRRMREAMRAADDRNGADGTLVRVARPRTKAPCYLLRRFHTATIIPKNAARRICRGGRA